MTIFTLPLMFISCFAYEAKSYETIRGWRYEQPTTLIANKGSHNITIIDNYFYANDYNFCIPWDIK